MISSLRTTDDRHRRQAFESLTGRHIVSRDEFIGDLEQAIVKSAPFAAEIPAAGSRSLRLRGILVTCSDKI